MYVSKAYSLNIANQLYEFDLEDPSKGLRARRAGTIIDEKIKNSKSKKAKKKSKRILKPQKVQRNQALKKMMIYRKHCLMKKEPINIHATRNKIVSFLFGLFGKVFIKNKNLFTLERLY